MGFDPEFPSDIESAVPKLRLKNLNYKLHFDTADAGIAPTGWQASGFPQSFREKISVIHDGIDTQAAAPDPVVTFVLPGGRLLTRTDEVVTFVNRNLEPYRGYHIFMRSLPWLLKERPNAQVLIVGGDDVSYGARPSQGKTWKGIFADEVRPDVSDTNWERVHFLGKLPYEHFIALLQLSSVHVYLTYPFVLSWSLLEAMSAGCAIVASDTAPVGEVVRHEDTGLLVNFFDTERLATSVSSLLADQPLRERLGHRAREYAIVNYDLHSLCLPAQLQRVESIV